MYFLENNTAGPIFLLKRKILLRQAAAELLDRYLLYDNQQRRIVILFSDSSIFRCVTQIVMRRPGPLSIGPNRAQPCADLEIDIQKLGECMFTKHAFFPARQLSCVENFSTSTNVKWPSVDLTQFRHPADYYLMR